MNPDNTVQYQIVLTIKYDTETNHGCLHAQRNDFPFPMFSQSFGPSGHATLRKLLEQLPSALITPVRDVEVHRLPFGGQT